MLERLRSHLSRSFYKPGITGVLINPFHIARRGLYRCVQRMASHCTGSIIDLGCGTKPYVQLFDCAEYLGLDLPRQTSNTNIAADLFFDGKNLPLADESFDNAVTFQVFEHVFTPDLFLKEIHRVLKPNGHLLLTVPFVWDEHEQPYDFARYSSFGLKAVLEKAGFEIVESHKAAANISVLFQLTNDYLYKVLFTRNPIVNMFLAVLLTFPITLLGIVLGWLLPDNEDLYLDNVILARKVAPPL